MTFARDHLSNDRLRLELFSLLNLMVQSLPFTFTRLTARAMDGHNDASLVQREALFIEDSVTLPA